MFEVTMDKGDKVAGLVFWGTRQSLEEEGMDEYFTLNEEGSRGCQSEGTCAHRSHGFYAPEWSLDAQYPMTFLGGIPGNDDGKFYFRMEYEGSEIFLELKVSYHQHTKLVEICKDEVPDKLEDATSIREWEYAQEEESRKWRDEQRAKVSQMPPRPPRPPRSLYSDRPLEPRRERYQPPRFTGRR